MFNCKRFRPNPVFDLSTNPMPESLKKSMDIVGLNFYNARMRNLEIMDTSEQRLFAFMTNYDSQNYCWLQPTRVKSNTPEVEYDRYIKKINRQARTSGLEPLMNIKVGSNCVARYEVDTHWYRAVVIEESVNNKWLVLFIDYGNFQVCSQCDIAEPILDPTCDHFHAPMQAVLCRLYNIVPRTPNSRDEIDIKLESFYTKHTNSFLEVVVRNIRADYVVDCDVFLCTKGYIGSDHLFGKHIGQEIIESGIATYADPIAAHAIRIDSPVSQQKPIPCINLDDSDDEELDFKRKVKVETKPVVKVEPEIKVKTEPDTKIKTERDTKIKIEPDTKIKIEPDIKIKSEPDIKVKIEPFIKVETKPDVKAKVETKL